LISCFCVCVCSSVFKMVLPSPSEINAMNKSQLKEALTSILNADARNDLPSVIACLLAEMRKNHTETVQLRQDVILLKQMNENLQTQTEELKSEITKLNEKLNPDTSTASSSGDSIIRQGSSTWGS